MGLFDTIRTRLRGPSRQEVELDYLSGATSRVDLELRQREIDRGLFAQLPRRR
jgi:hypothetical protein